VTSHFFFEAPLSSCFPPPKMSLISSAMPMAISAALMMSFTVFSCMASPPFHQKGVSSLASPSLKPLPSVLMNSRVLAMSWYVLLETPSSVSHTWRSRVPITAIFAPLWRHLAAMSASFWKQTTRIQQVFFLLE